MLAPRRFFRRPAVPVPPPRSPGAGPLRRYVSAAVGLVMLLQAPVALAQGGARSTSWSALKNPAPEQAPLVDPAMSPAEVRAALQATSRLRPAVVPQVIQSLPLDTGVAVYSVSGPSGADLFVTHVVTADGRRVGTTVFDQTRGVIRDASGERVFWTAPSGDLQRDLQRIHELQGSEEMLRSVANTVCNILLVGGSFHRCLVAIVATPMGFMACLGIMIALAALCYLLANVTMPPDPDQEVGQSSGLQPDGP